MKLYHYTDFVALDGILHNREMRVNNVLNMNDATEMDLFITGIITAVSNRFSPTEEGDIIQMLKNMLEEARGKYFEYSFYAACFSGYRDDASQWERYASRGKGVCLCFQQEILEKMTSRSIFLRKVYYQLDMDSHPLVQRIYDLLKENRNRERTDELLETVFEVWRNSASFKHPSFSSEHETRLIVMPFADKNFKLLPGYHVTRERIKKYYPLDLDAMCAQADVTIEDLITEIIIGPESTQSIPILQDYLSDNGLKKLARNIVYSNCPLRSKM